MAEQQPAQQRTGTGRGGRGGQSFGGGRGGAPGGAGRPARGGPGGRRGAAADWKPLTKLGRLVLNNEIKTFEQIFDH